jgi:hypothetical protein
LTALTGEKFETSFDITFSIMRDVRPRRGKFGTLTDSLAE